MLHPEVYEELRSLAAARMAGQPGDHTMQPTVLVHEAWLRITGKGNVWHDRRHFVAVAATAMRHILIDHARKKAAPRHGGGHLRIDTRSFHSIAAPDRDERVLLIDEAISALEKVDPARAQVVVTVFRRAQPRGDRRKPRHQRTQRRTSLGRGQSLVAPLDAAIRGRIDRP